MSPQNTTKGLHTASLHGHVPWWRIYMTSETKDGSPYLCFRPHPRLVSKGMQVKVGSGDCPALHCLTFNSLSTYNSNTDIGGPQSPGPCPLHLPTLSPQLLTALMSSPYQPRVIFHQHQDAKQRQSLDALHALFSEAPAHLKSVMFYLVVTFISTHSRAVKREKTQA